MGLLDYFAGKAMQGLIARHGGYSADESAQDEPEVFSEKAPHMGQVSDYAYQQAYAMLQARKKFDAWLDQQP